MDSRLKAILFDFGGTLDDDGVPWKDRFYAFYREEGLMLDVDDFAGCFYRADDSLIGRLGDDLGFRDTIRLLVERLEPLLPSGPSGRGGRVAARFHGQAVSRLRRNRSCLEQLATRFKLGIVSNFYGNLPSVAGETEIAHLFGAIIDSARVGAEKPSPAIFRPALAALGVAAADCVFVGDSLVRDGAGAEAAGMGFIWIADDDCAASERPAVRHRIPRVTALPGILERLEGAA